MKSIETYHFVGNVTFLFQASSFNWIRNEMVWKSFEFLLVHIFHFHGEQQQQNHTHTHYNSWLNWRRKWSYVQLKWLIPHINLLLELVTSEPYFKDYFSLAITETVCRHISLDKNWLKSWIELRAGLKVHSKNKMIKMSVTWVFETSC